MRSSLICSFALLQIFFLLRLDSVVEGHGRLMDPPSRSSLWRFPEFKNHKPSPEINVNDNELFCGGYDVQHEYNGGKCGICGDPFNQTKPRDNEDGGIFGQRIISRRFRVGQIIPIHVELTAPHWGYWQLRLCPTAEGATEECFDRHLLTFAGSQETKYYVITEDDGEHHGPKSYSTSAQLPAGVRCERCVLQWHYHTGNRWGECGDGSQAMGCGPQETFRGCADISIS